MDVDDYRKIDPPPSGWRRLEEPSTGNRVATDAEVVSRNSQLLTTYFLTEEMSYSFCFFLFSSPSLVIVLFLFFFIFSKSRTVRKMSVTLRWLLVHVDAFKPVNAGHSISLRLRMLTQLTRLSILD